MTAFYTRIALTVLLALPAGLVLGGEMDEGRALFERKWAASANDKGGLGPLFNEASCASCHKNGGGARFVVGGGGDIAAAGGVLRLASGDGRPDPVYGRQLQSKAIAGSTPEGRIYSHLEPRPDGLEQLALRVELNGRPLATTTRMSLRVAPSTSRRRPSRGSPRRQSSPMPIPGIATATGFPAAPVRCATGTGRSGSAGSVGALARRGSKIRSPRRWPRTWA